MKFETTRRACPSRRTLCTFAGPPVEVNEEVRQFYGFSMRKYIDLAQHILFEQKYLHFFLTGISGVALNLGLTWLLTTYVFGLAQYFRAYLIGVSFNLVYNFVLHTIVTFNTKERHVRRFVWFVVYSILLTLLQAYVVRTITPIIGLEYYLLVIATTIFLFSTVTFVFFKYMLFREPHESGVV